MDLDQIKVDAQLGHPYQFEARLTRVVPRHQNSATILIFEGSSPAGCRLTSSEQEGAARSLQPGNLVTVTGTYAGIQQQHLDFTNCQIVKVQP